MEKPRYDDTRLLIETLSQSERESILLDLETRKAVQQLELFKHYLADESIDKTIASRRVKSLLRSNILEFLLQSSKQRVSPDSAEKRIQYAQVFLSREMFRAAEKEINQAKKDNSQNKVDQFLIHETELHLIHMMHDHSPKENYQTIISDVHNTIRQLIEDDQDVDNENLEYKTLVLLYSELHAMFHDRTMVIDELGVQHVKSQLAKAQGVFSNQDIVSRFQFLKIMTLGTRLLGQKELYKKNLEESCSLFQKTKNKLTKHEIFTYIDHLSQLAQEYISCKQYTEAHQILKNLRSLSDKPNTPKQFCLKKITFLELQLASKSGQEKRFVALENKYKQTDNIESLFLLAQHAYTQGDYEKAISYMNRIDGGTKYNQKSEILFFIKVLRFFTEVMNLSKETYSREYLKNNNASFIAFYARNFKEERSFGEFYDSIRILMRELNKAISKDNYHFKIIDFFASLHNAFSRFLAPEIKNRIYDILQMHLTQERLIHVIDQELPQIKLQCYYTDSDR